MITRICVSILPKTNEEALSLVDEAEKVKADFIEVRLDYLETSQNLSDLVNSTKIPLIATNKLRSEQGFFSGTQTQRQQILLDAAKKGCQYVDVELSSQKHKETIDQLKQLGAKPIVSHHKFNGALSASEMEKIFASQIASGASVCKIVTTATKVEDNLTALNFVSSASSRAKLVCFCMGKQGKISRLLSPLFGAFFTFASLTQGNETASGQMSISQLRTAYNLLEMK